MEMDRVTVTGGDGEGKRTGGRGRIGGGAGRSPPEVFIGRRNKVRSPAQGPPAS